MVIAVSADEQAGVAPKLVAALERRGHTVTPFGALSAGLAEGDWVGGTAAAAGAVASGNCDQAIVACWTGTGASIAANKVGGIRAALCTDAATAAGARRWNDANCLTLSLRLTSDATLDEILDAWFTAAPSVESGDLENLRRLAELDRPFGGLTEDT